jgi:hypothetical protein
MTTATLRCTLQRSRTTLLLSTCCSSGARTPTDCSPAMPRRDVVQLLCIAQVFFAVAAEAADADNDDDAVAAASVAV